MAGVILLAAAALLAGAPASESDLRSRIAQAPKDLAAFVERRADCNHWAGEEPYDRQRSAEIERALRKLRCARIERDEIVLRAEYRQQPVLLMLLDETADSLGW